MRIKLARRIGLAMVAASSLILSTSFAVGVPVPGSNPGRWLHVKSTAAQTINSASANVVPRAGGAAGTALLANTVGKWAKLQSDGVNWVIMAAN